MIVIIHEIEKTYHYKEIKLLLLFIDVVREIREREREVGEEEAREEKMFIVA